MASNAKPAAMKTMACKVVGTCVVLAHSDSAFTADEWQNFLDTTKSVTGPKVRLLVDTPGVGPSARERAQLALALKGRDFVIAVLCDARVIRGLIMAASWTGLNVKGFPTTNVQGAMDFLGVPAAQQGTVESTIAQMKRAVGR